MVGSIDGPFEALGCVIFCTLVKFTIKKNWLLTDGPMDGHTLITVLGRFKTPTIKEGRLKTVLRQFKTSKS